MATAGVLADLPVPRARRYRMRHILGRVLLALLAALAILAIAFVWRPVTVLGAVTRTILWSKGVRGADVQVAGHRLHVLSGGEGRPVLLLHGMGGRADDFASIMPSLMAAGFSVHALDLLGYGNSDRPDVDYSIALEADTVRQFLEARQLSQVDLIGWSMGGWVGLKLAAGHPDRVRTLTLVDSAGFDFPPPDPRVLRPRTREELEKMAALFSPKAGSIPGFIARDMLRVMQEQDWVVARALDSMYSRRDLMDGKVGSVTMPVHLVWGSRDVLTPIAAGHKMHREIAQSKLSVIDGCGHVALIECRDRAVPLMVDFLRRH